MVDLFTEEIYKNVVEGNMELYKQFFSCDPNEEGTIEYWKNAIGLYNRLDDEGKQVLLSIIKSTIVDTISNVMAILDGSEGPEDISIKVQLNDHENDCELQNSFLAYAEDHEEE